MVRELLTDTLSVPHSPSVTERRLDYIRPVLPLARPGHGLVLHGSVIVLLLRHRRALQRPRGEAGHAFALRVRMEVCNADWATQRASGKIDRFQTHASVDECMGEVFVACQPVVLELEKRMLATARYAPYGPLSACTQAPCFSSLTA